MQAGQACSTNTAVSTASPVSASDPSETKAFAFKVVEVCLCTRRHLDYEQGLLGHPQIEVKHRTRDNVLPGQKLRFLLASLTTRLHEEKQQHVVWGAWEQGSLQGTCLKCQPAVWESTENGYRVLQKLGSGQSA